MTFHGRARYATAPLACGSQGKDGALFSMIYDFLCARALREHTQTQPQANSASLTWQKKKKLAHFALTSGSEDEDDDDDQDDEWNKKGRLEEQQ